MTDKELRHLNRGELLQMLIIQGEEIRRLKEQLAEANKKLNERQVIMKNAGSIAEAALRLNGVFEAAEKAAQQYLESVAAMSAAESSEHAALASLDVDFILHNQTASNDATDDRSTQEYRRQVQSRVQTIIDDLT